MRALLILILVLFAGCATSKPPPEPLTAQDQQFAIRNQAWSLLYQLMSDEGDVSKLLLIKKELPDVDALIKDISKTASDAAKQMEAFSKADSHLHLKMSSLPRAEIETRESISKTRAKELISKTGEKFELRVLLTQSEALTYGAHLAVVAKAYETDATRAQFLGDLSRQMQDLHQRLINLMHERWQMPASR